MHSSQEELIRLEGLPVKDTSKDKGLHKGNEGRNWKPETKRKKAEQRDKLIKKLANSASY
jgi:hypothetical protein